MKHRNLRKSVFAAGAVAAMLVLTAIPAFAAQTVSSMRITFTNKYEDPGVIEEPEITCSTSGVEIESVEWSKDIEKWKPATKMTATLILSADRISVCRRKRIFQYLWFKILPDFRRNTRKSGERG